jgi:putative methyltransferase (TIGR04325 family)
VRSIRRYLELVLPPIAVKLLRLPQGEDRPSAAADWERVADTDEAWTGHAGWTHASIVATQESNWDTIMRSIAKPRPVGQFQSPAKASPDISTHNTIITFAYALARASLQRKRISVLDWGGALGHYYAYARELGPAVEIDYVIKDLEQFCEAGRKRLPNVTFLSSDTDALSRQYDFVFASASLQYARDLYGCLERLARSAREWLMVTRIPIIENNDDFVVVQRPHAHGYMTEYACWYINRRRFLDCVAGQGFSLEREFLLGDAANVLNAPENGRYTGFLFRRTRPNLQ